MRSDLVVPTLLGLLATSAIANPITEKASSQNKVNRPPFGYKSGSPQSIANLKSKIHNVVWILLENRAFDNILGGVKRDGLDNPINNGPFSNPQSLSDPKGTTFHSQYKDFDSILNDPDHSVTGNNFEFYGTFSPDNKAIAEGKLTPKLDGFVNKQLISYPTLSPTVAAEQVLGYYSEDEIPTLVDIVDEFTTFNYWHSCVPGVSLLLQLCFRKDRYCSRVCN
jgi:phospholipase C